ncbi:hypothetical protein B0J12DRAFT_680514 [Macrophomina phaseolina]|uniref:AAA+ ATPase domain-containing protein n=1 Tax=Macrophomina phaseolina TaxID=35725 RepID=A0ABQ8FXE5_9PEZI|nr:hypothetical protein B0J12DRAFT_680514 [Macrophomina phaseolina]
MMSPDSASAANAGPGGGALPHTPHDAPPPGEARPEQTAETNQKSHDQDPLDVGHDADIPVASVETSNPGDEPNEGAEDSTSEHVSNSEIDSGSDSEISDLYDKFRPSESPTSSVRGWADKRMRRHRPPMPLRYARQATHEKIRDHGSFLTFLCDRLAYMEHEIETLRTGSKLPSPMTYPPPPPPPPPALVFPITEYGDFQWYNRRNLLYLDTRFVIEVLLGQDNVGMQNGGFPRQEESARPMPDIQQGRKPGYNSSDIPNAPPNLIPQRIRINSIVLIEKLTDISEEAFSGSSSVVFIRPFKMFVKHENAIRKALEQQEALVQELTQGMHTLMDMERAKTDAVALQGGALEHSTDSLHTSQSDADCHDTPIKVLTDDLDTANGYGLAFQQWEDESTLCEHLRLLVHLFDGPLMPILDLYHSIRDGSADQIPFDYLWYLFEHGQEIIQQGPLWQVCRVLSFTGGREISAGRFMVTTEAGLTLTPPPPPAPPLPPNMKPPPLPKSSFSVDCYRWEFDGESFVPVVTVNTIKPYNGLKDITSLPVYPLYFNKKSGIIREALMARGKRFISLTKRAETVHRHYTGITLESDCTSAEEIDSRIIVDQRLAILEIPSWKPKNYNPTRTPADDDELFALPPSHGDYIHVDHNQDMGAARQWFSKQKHILESAEDLVSPPEEDRILLPHFLYGFVLRSRRWAKLNIDLITNIEDKNSFDDLVLPEGHARSIKALVENHNRGPSKDKETDHVDVSMDLVRGKGKGVIILLHGEPGVGKTSTAECIADYTSRPLYPITCGDIGETADEVERNLEKTFQLAHKWGCVLLLDEADIFLQERNKENMRRNAVVSVFLRVLEYYSGILFLTTNRVGIIDQAFRSRIHLSLYYPSLDKDATMTIWKMHLQTARDRFQRKGQTLEVEKKKILKFAKEQFKRMKKETGSNWNGRQIRNAFQTAIALAEYHAEGKGRDRKTKLTVAEFKTVQDTSDSFDKYLLATQKTSQAAQARLARTREDGFLGQDAAAKGGHRRRKALSRRTKQVEVTPETDSTVSSESSDTEPSSTEDDDVSDNDFGRKQSKRSQGDSESGENSDKEKGKDKRRTGKDKKVSPRALKKRYETSSDEEVQMKSRRRTTKLKDDRPEASEPEIKVKGGRGKKKDTVGKEDCDTNSETEVKAEKKRGKR